MARRQPLPIQGESSREINPARNLILSFQSPKLSRKKTADPNGLTGALGRGDRRSCPRGPVLGEPLQTWSVATYGGGPLGAKRPPPSESRREAREASRGWAVGPRPWASVAMSSRPWLAHPSLTRLGLSAVPRLGVGSQDTALRFRTPRQGTPRRTQLLSTGNGLGELHTRLPGPPRSRSP